MAVMSDGALNLRRVAVRPKWVDRVGGFSVISNEKADSLMGIKSTTTFREQERSVCTQQEPNEA